MYIIMMILIRWTYIVHILSKSTGTKVVGIHKAIIKVHYDWDNDYTTTTYFINGVKKTKAAFDKWTNAYKYSLQNTTLKSIYGKTR